jgi:hypothetical protein
MGVYPPLPRVSEADPPKKKNWRFFASIFSNFLAHGFVDGFLILVKELGFFTNLGQWIRGFGCCRILYIVL